MNRGGAICQNARAWYAIDPALVVRLRRDGRCLEVRGADDQPASERVRELLHSWFDDLVRILPDGAASVLLDA